MIEKTLDYVNCEVSAAHREISWANGNDTTSVFRQSQIRFKGPAVDALATSHFEAGQVCRMMNFIQIHVRNRYFRIRVTDESLALEEIIQPDILHQVEGEPRLGIPYISLGLW